jgi:hypothetical protein
MDIIAGFLFTLILFPSPSPNTPVELEGTTLTQVSSLILSRGMLVRQHD